ncbi:hypothetical protein [Streptomyces sp. NPDC056061]|uniref:hypothetical protein n=1 Tax=Streptomyces sp. NPDC056061 TaxID=3345700 RepID=UPI0035D8DF04
MSAFKCGPLKWETPDGYTPESIRQAGRVGHVPIGAVRSMLNAADEAHLKALYAENARVGEARQVVGDVARVLGVNIDVGPGHRWDVDHMQRAVAAAVEMREYAARMEQERDDLRGRLADLETSAEYWSATAPGGSLIDDLKNTIVSQAREIARLMGESV